MTAGTSGRAASAGHPVAGLPGGISGWQTLRTGGGASVGRHGGPDGRPALNLGDHVGDDPAAVAANRATLAAMLPAPVLWLRQVHGIAVVDADAWPGHGAPPEADAAVATQPGRVLAIQTADCLPVLFAARDAGAVAAAHAGWRGLHAGILEATLEALRARGVGPGEVVAWLGPCIGPRAFEVGEEVRDAFVRVDAGAGRRFRPGAQPGKWHADLAGLAVDRLRSAGVVALHVDGRCTVADPGCFSYRRDRVTGRMASLIWRDR